MQQRPQPRITASRSPSRVKIISSSNNKSNSRGGKRPRLNEERGKNTSRDSDSDSSEDYDRDDDEDIGGWPFSSICSTFTNPRHRWKAVGVSVLVLTLVVSLAATVLSLVYLSNRHAQSLQLSNTKGEDNKVNWQTYFQWDATSAKKIFDKMKNTVSQSGSSTWRGQARWFHPSGINSGNTEKQTSRTASDTPVASPIPSITSPLDESISPKENEMASIVPPEYKHSTTMQMIFTRQYLHIANQTRLNPTKVHEQSQSPSQDTSMQSENENGENHKKMKQQKMRDKKKKDEEIDTSIDATHAELSTTNVQNVNGKGTAQQSHHNSETIKTGVDVEEVWSDGIHSISTSTGSDGNSAHYDIYIQNPPALKSALSTAATTLPSTALKGIVVLLHTCTIVGDVWWNHDYVRAHYLSMVSSSGSKVGMTDGDEEVEGENTNHHSSTIIKMKKKRAMNIALSLPIESSIASSLLAEGYVVMAFTLSSASTDAVENGRVTHNNKRPCWKKEDAPPLYHSINRVLEPLLNRLPSLSILPIHFLTIGNGGIFLQNHVLPCLLQRSPSLTFSLSSAGKKGLEWLQQSAIAQLQGIILMHCGLYNQQSLQSIYKNKVVHTVHASSNHHNKHTSNGHNSSTHSLTRLTKSLKVMLIDSSRNGDVASHNQQTVDHLKPLVKKSIVNAINSGGAMSVFMGIDGGDDANTLASYYIQHLVSDPYPLTEDLLLTMFTSLQRNDNDVSKHSLMISQDETKALLNVLRKEQFLWPANYILVKDPTDPIYMESFKNIIRTAMPRFAPVIDNMHVSSNYHIYFLDDDSFTVKYAKHAISSLLQIVKFAWGYKETTDEYVEDILRWMTHF